MLAVLVARVRRCTIGTVSGGISTPKSPLATIRPSATARIASRHCTASGFSIFGDYRVFAISAFFNQTLEIRHIFRPTNKRQRQKINSYPERKSRPVYPSLLKLERYPDAQKADSCPFCLSKPHHEPPCNQSPCRLPDSTLNSNSPSSSRIRSPG
jgi:hypothetical protein